MKNVIRVLSLVMCLAMLIGVFAMSALAAEGQHLKLTHEADEESRVAALANLPDTQYAIERGKIGAKDLTFDAKISSGARMKIEFYAIFDATKSDGTNEKVARRVTVNVVDGVAYCFDQEMGALPSSVDATAWNTYTLRCSRQSGYSGTYDVQLFVNGLPVENNGATMDNQGGGSSDRMAFHATKAGTVEIDNVVVEDKLLDNPMGSVDNDSVAAVFATDFGAAGSDQSATWEILKHAGTAGEFAAGDSGASSAPSTPIAPPAGDEDDEETPSAPTTPSTGDEGSDKGPSNNEHKGPSETGDASIIAMAAMMLPASGVGLGALCIKRKKEN